MKNVIISNDDFLIKSLSLISDNVKYNAINNVRHYVTDFTASRKIVFVDDRVKNISLLSIRNSYRKNDILIRVNFIQDEKKFSFFEHSIKAGLPLEDFIESTLKVFALIKSSKNILEKKPYLTPMQAEVLSMFLSGMSIASICSYFIMSEKNICNYKTILTRKYGCRNFRDFYKSFILE